MGKCTAIWIHRELTGQKKSLRTQKKKLTARIIWLNCQLFDYKPEKPFSFDPATIYNYNLLYMEVTKIVYFIGNEHMLIAHDSNRLRFS